MKKLIILICVFLGSSTLSHSQEIQFAKKNNTILPADTNSYQIVENLGNVDVHNDIDIRRKITSYRKSDSNFLLDFGDGLKILIFKEEE